MEDLLKTIRERMITDSSNYSLMAEYRVQLSSLYSTMAEKSKDYVIKKAAFQNGFRDALMARKEKVSVSLLDREWEMSADGVQMELLKISMGAIENMMSSLNTLIRIANTDYYHTK